MRNRNSAHQGQIIKTYIADPAWHGLMLREVLRNNLMISRKLLAEVKFQGGALFVNGKNANVSDQVFTGDHIEVWFPREDISSSIKMSCKPLSIRYEDEWCIVIDKPAGLLTIPNETYENDSVAGRVIGYFKSCDHPATFHPVTRLDRQTSGLMLIAKDRHSHSLFMKQQCAGLIDKEYVAVTPPGFPWIAATVDAPIARHPDSIIERMVHHEGQKAKTRLVKVNENASGSLIRCKLETGRTHQIRVHLAFTGWSILGDGLYREEKSADEHKRTLLHACSLRWDEPFTGERIEIHESVPEDFPFQY
ncbi:RluA family pseudouridine synthase [Salisediminibacterium selenitireducens]|uniref:Pseudouridine synthase n=1 Tax=Bacillus selenitireducens (strain ATCC 700615 / DSM 15326 / MLS10) TaxID=439292 RepID=D6XTD2_BACIE|nr:RluA family pseudouridine synthase [Salisediminibacterium selenitireducens]ADH99068.1 pseudouridine synthase [[Bacillus] selenitireducens MLS10]